MRESTKAPSISRQCTESERGLAILSIFAVPTMDERLAIHPHLLFGIMIPFIKDALCRVGLVPRF